MKLCGAYTALTYNIRQASQGKGKMQRAKERAKEKLIFQQGQHPAMATRPSASRPMASCGHFQQACCGHFQRLEYQRLLRVSVDRVSAWRPLRGLWKNHYPKVPQLICPLLKLDSHEQQIS